MAKIILGKRPKSFKRTDWLDGPHVIAEHRNAVVHPSAKNREKLRQSGTAQLEAMNTSIWRYFHFEKAWRFK